MFLGFGLMTVLLLTVGIVGYLALSTIQKQADGLFKQIDIFSESNDAVMSSYEAQLASNRHLMSKDIKYAVDVTKHVREVVTSCAAAKKMMVDQTNKNSADTIAREAKQYDTLDDEFSASIVRLAEMKNTQKTAYETAKKESDELDTMIERLARSDEYSIKQSFEVDGKTEERAFIHDDRVTAIRRNAEVARLMEQARVATREYETEIDSEKRETIHATIGNYFEKMFEICQDIRDNYMVTDAGRQVVDNAVNGLKVWHTSVDNTVNELKAIDANKTKQDQLAVRVGDAIVKIIDGVQNSVNNTGNSMKSLITTVTQTIIIVAIIAVALGIFAGIVLTKNIATGLGIAVNALTRMSKEGDLTVEVPAEYMRRKDELGELGHALTAVINEFRSVEHLAKELAGGNWLTTVKVRGELDAMNVNLSAMLDQVNTALGNTSHAVEQVAGGAAQVASASESLSQGATESAASIEEITASMNEIGSQTNANAQNANDANKLAQGANSSAAQGQAMMKQMIASMEAITKNSQDIQKVVKVIDDISFQTNLLALNAAVEAARAGVHGKGFAVVAEEVRNLASRSAKAAAETTVMIDNNSRQINEGAEIAQQTGEMLDGIVDQSRQVATLLKEIANASNEQAQGVAQVSQGLHQIDSVTQQNTASAEETASVSNEMSSQATILQQLIGQFQIRRSA